MPARYDFVPGESVHSSWVGRTVPVPVKTVRERLRLPARYAMATLSPDVKETYSVGLYDTAMTYLRSWPSYQTRGMAPVFAGPTGAGTSWTAAGLVNEIVTRSEGTQDVVCSWLSTFWMLRLMTDYRQSGNYDAYNALRNNMIRHQIIVVDDLLGARQVEGGVPLLHTIYAARYDAGLPTITTVTTNEQDIWREIRNAFGKQFVDRLQATSAGIVGWVHNVRQG